MTSHLILGGARSGKSSYAESLASEYAQVTYIATAPRYEGDAEWENRLAHHISRRPESWKTLETTDLELVISMAQQEDCLIIDCLTLWLTHVLDRDNAWDFLNDPAKNTAIQTLLRDRFIRLAGHISDSSAAIFIVSNEVGQGIVPSLASTRFFQDMMGVLNLTVAQACDKVTFVTAGIASRLK